MKTVGSQTKNEGSLKLWKAIIPVLVENIKRQKIRSAKDHSKKFLSGPAASFSGIIHLLQAHKIRVRVIFGWEPNFSHKQSKWAYLSPKDPSLMTWQVGKTLVVLSLQQDPAFKKLLFRYESKPVSYTTRPFQF